MLAKKTLPDMVETVSSALTPMVATARTIKQRHPEAKIVFVGPCAAKKLEASRRSVRSDVDFVITFEELDAIFTAKGIDMETYDAEEPIHDATGTGRGYAVAGGVANAIENCINEYYPGTEVYIEHAEGLSDCQKMLLMVIEELHGMGFEQVVLTGVQFPNIITRKQEFAAAGGKSQEGRAALLAADISTWQARFDGSVVLWLSYPAQQCTDASDALGAPAVSLGMHNLIVTADTLDAAARGQLQQSAAEAGVQNVVICSTESFQ